MFDPSSYQDIYLIASTILTIYAIIISSWYGEKSWGNKKTTDFVVLLFVFLLTLFMGLRPIDETFVDTVTYARLYESYQSISSANLLGQTKDYFFTYISFLLSKFLDVQLYFLLLEVLYVVPRVLALKKFFNGYLAIATVLLVTDLFFFAYGVNTIRSGIASGFSILGLSFIFSDKREYLKGVVLMVIGTLFHFSVMLYFAVLVAVFLQRNTRVYLLFWGVSIGASYFLLGQITNWIESLNFLVLSDRISSYMESASIFDTYNRGFRLDFILYSTPPILMGVYFKEVKRMTNNTYSALLNFYILTNALWILIINASYSDRFAYLSWCLYSLVMYYPVHKFSKGNERFLLTTLALTLNLTLLYVL